MNKINIGIFVNTISNNHLLEKIYTEFSNNSYVKDVSVFYKQATHEIPKYLKCGVFPSVNIMNFGGVLICDSIDNAQISKEAINSIKVYSSLSGYNFIKYYLVGSNIKYFSITKEENEVFYRETKNKVDIDCSQDFSDLTKYIIENER